VGALLVIRARIESCPVERVLALLSRAIVAVVVMLSWLPQAAAQDGPALRPQPDFRLPAFGSEFDAWQRYFAAGLGAEAGRDHRGALAAFEAAVREARTQTDLNTLPLVASLNKLGWHLHATSDRAGAEKAFREAVRLVEAGASPSFQLSIALNGLARLITERRTAGAFTDGLSVYRRAIDNDNRVLEQGDPRRAWNLLGSGDHALRYGHLPHAADYYVRALRTMERAFGPDHLELVEPLEAVAVVAYTNGQPVQAQRLYQRALAIQEARLGPGHCDLRRTLHRLALVHRGTGSDIDPDGIELEKRFEQLVVACRGK
jgi:tetratricopeptide (TPR) repeat protein